MLNSLSGDLLEEFEAWAFRERTIIAIVLFGSRVRSADAVNRSDRWSDVDLQVVTTKTKQFETREWVASFSKRELCAYAVRAASGGVKKVTAIFHPRDELDIVVVPSRRLRLVRSIVSLGFHSKIESVNSALNELATVLRPGYRVLKGDIGWVKFYKRVVVEMPGTRLSNVGVKALAEEFVCDFIWLLQKLERGELIASQRMLHRSLVEINFRLLHELRLRQNQLSFREARRIERILTKNELADIATEASLGQASLRAAAEKNALVLRKLVTALIDGNWRWPNLI